MTNAEPRLDFHIRVSADRLEELDALIRDFQPYVIRVGPAIPAGKPYVLDALVSGDLVKRLEAAGNKVEVIAKLNQPEDLPKQVSQTNRYAAELERRRRERR